jgi:hypothetical protein
VARGPFRATPAIESPRLDRSRRRTVGRAADRPVRVWRGLARRRAGRKAARRVWPGAHSEPHPRSSHHTRSLSPRRNHCVVADRGPVKRWRLRSTRGSGAPGKTGEVGVARGPFRATPAIESPHLDRSRRNETCGCCWAGEGRSGSGPPKGRGKKRRGGCGPGPIPSHTLDRDTTPRSFSPKRNVHWYWAGELEARRAPRSPRTRRTRR